MFRSCRSIIVLVTFAMLVGCMTEVSHPSHSVSSNRPNVIVVLADDMRGDAVGFMGNRLIRTPNLDSLAQKGTVFTQAFATSAVCTPSRTTLLTGLYERRHGINFNSKSALSDQSWAQSYPMLMKDGSEL